MNWIAGYKQHYKALIFLGLPIVIGHTGLTAYGPGYIDESMKDLEQVVGLQTDKPLKRAFMPYGGIKMAEESCENYGYTPDPELHKIFTEYHKTHNQGVFDAYTPEMRAARRSHIITGLPDTYGRGRIVQTVFRPYLSDRKGHVNPPFAGA